jgi:hypothetical protein
MLFWAVNIIIKSFNLAEERADLSLATVFHKKCQLHKAGTIKMA